MKSLAVRVLSDFGVDGIEPQSLGSRKARLALHLLAARAARLTADFEGAEAHLKRCLKLQQGATEATQLEFLLMRAQTGEEDVVAPALG